MVKLEVFLQAQQQLLEQLMNILRNIQTKNNQEILELMIFNQL